jgi:hypothetical protein
MSNDVGSLANEGYSFLDYFIATCLVYLPLPSRNAVIVDVEIAPRDSYQLSNLDFNICIVFPLAAAVSPGHAACPPDEIGLPLSTTESLPLIFRYRLIN